MAAESYCAPTSLEIANWFVVKKEKGFLQELRKISKDMNRQERILVQQGHLVLSRVSYTIVPLGNDLMTQIMFCRTYSKNKVKSHLPNAKRRRSRQSIGKTRIDSILIGFDLTGR